MKYLSYDEYKAFGGELYEEGYLRYAFRAERLIDQETFGRLKDFDKIPFEVKRLTFELMALAHKGDISAERVSSEKVGDWQRSYKSPSAASYSKAGAALVRSYLSGIFTPNGIPLLYRGVDE